MNTDYYDVTPGTIDELFKNYTKEFTPSMAFDHYKFTMFAEQNGVVPGVAWFSETWKWDELLARSFIERIVKMEELREKREDLKQSKSGF